MASLKELLAHECFVLFDQPVLIKRNTVSWLDQGIIDDIPFLLLAEVIILVVDLLKHDLWLRLVVWELLLACVLARCG